MVTKILVDTDILLKSYRGDKNKFSNLQLIKERFSISVVTAFELLKGANNYNKLYSTKRELKTYSILHIDKDISVIAYKLYLNYTINNSLGIPDCLIAATALYFDLALYTDNKKHFDFIKNIKFYEEK